MAEKKTENGYELWLKGSHDIKSGEIRPFLEVPHNLESNIHWGSINLNFLRATKMDGGRSELLSYYLHLDKNQNQSHRIICC